MTTMVDVYLGLGSNQDNPAAQLEQAIESLHKDDQLTVKAISSNYRSAPIGPGDQDDYINAVVCVETSLSAEQLLDCLQEIENRQGRVRKQRWGERTLDLDILLYDNEIIDTERLTIPHKELSNRNFVLLPLMEITSEEFQIPGEGALLDLLSRCVDNPIEKI
jgi:2-amino-4-hydroxy-6-hydroxymethyldihydropteridine diphosphokinase